MVTKYYKCSFLSDIVLPASSNTQGNIALSDFISGSNFLGMVAAAYDSFGSEAFDVFHSGAVRFGDAHLMVNDVPSFKTPLSFHNLKVGEGYYNRLHVSDDEEQMLRAEQKQLKQLRSGFINEAFFFATPEYSYAQKSSYNKELRRSKDEGMFGYSALKRGTEWLFKVVFQDEKFIDQIEENLLGDKKLGKSRSSQYGQVHISSFEHIEDMRRFVPEENLTYLYLNSRVALVDDEGNPTAIPTIENLGLNGGAIIWEKSYIKTSHYHPFNYIRETKEYTRVCLNKGCVITVKGLEGNVENGVGAFLSEGFGEILINPKFLEVKHPDLQKYHKSDVSEAIGEYDQNLVSFLQSKEQKQQEKFDVASHVQKVFKQFIGPSKSQWGEIRSIAGITKDVEDLLSKIDAYVKDGVSKKQWESKKEKLFTEIKSSDNPLAFTRLLSQIVSKHTKGEKDAK